MSDARKLIAAITADTFGEFEPDLDPLPQDGPLDWAGYGESLARARERTGETESVLCGTGMIGDTAVAILGFDFRFLGGSIGSATGDRIVNAIQEAALLRLPVVSLIATGGSRMQEGMFSLLQLQRIARELSELRESGVPHIAVLRNPTTGGVWASLGAGADIIVGVAGAQVGFAGSRVRPAKFADDPAYTAEGQLAAGQVDEVVEESELGFVLGAWIGLLVGPGRWEMDAAPVPRPLGKLTLAAGGWEAVQQARAATRPRAVDYLNDYFDMRRSISGDRCGGVDQGMLCGIGQRDGQSIAYAAQTGTANTPAGFRTATRLIRLAERFGLPVLTLIDTPGASPDPAAETAGLGPALAELFGVLASTRTPVTTLVIGEGGSGGALAMSAPGRTWITPDAYFSVIAPELAAAILKRSPSDVPATAEALKLRPKDLLKLGVVRGIARP